MARKPVLHDDTTAKGLLAGAGLFVALAATLSFYALAALPRDTHRNEIPFEIEPAAPADLPLAFDRWAGPYRNAAGEYWTQMVNDWWREKTAAGLEDDVFRSFDDGHSTIRAAYCPQMTFLSAVGSYLPPTEKVLVPRVTFGVQSFGSSGHRASPVSTACTLDLQARLAVADGSPVEDGRRAPAMWPDLFAMFSQRNFLLVVPTAGSFADGTDHFAFLSPYYLASVGFSGSDAKLLKPLVMASAALPPAVKGRAMREGVYTPLRMQLWKSSVTGDIRDIEAHRPGYGLPEEANDDHKGPAPFLERIMSNAHGLAHVPPVARLALRSHKVEVRASGASVLDPYIALTPSALFAALRRGQALVADLDVSPSWFDGQNHVHEVLVKRIGGEGEVEYLNDDRTAFRITVPWRGPSRGQTVRADFLILVRDSEYWSSPAYVSVWSMPRTGPIPP